jgi:GntR family transcriptional repressor for pyruvate dehydrogenase complex
MATEFLKKVNRTTLAADVFRQLVGHLINGEWKEGERIPPERVLCSQLGVGRASLREAMKALEIMGMIETRLGAAGTFVCSRSEFFSRPMLWAIAGGAEKDIRQMIEARRCLEVELAGLAAERATTEHLNVMNTQIQIMEGAKDQTGVFVNADLSFHLAIAQAADNQILLDAYQFIRNLMQHWILERTRIGGMESQALEQHCAIFRAISEKDRDKARSLMGTHVDTVGLGSGDLRNVPEGSARIDPSLFIHARKDFSQPQNRNSDHEQ